MIRKVKYIAISKQIEKAIANGVYAEQLPSLFKLAEAHTTTHILYEKGLVSVNATRGIFISEGGNIIKNMQFIQPNMC